MSVRARFHGSELEVSDGPVLPGVKINLKVPKDVTRDTVTFARRILGPLAEIGDLFSDKVRFLRFKSAAKTLNRAAEIAKEQGISPKAIPMKFLVPFIEDCSLEEEDGPFIEQWAALLASASKGFDPLHVAIKDVLKHISSREAELIGALGMAIEPKLLEDKVSSYQVVEQLIPIFRASWATTRANSKWRCLTVISTGC
jgi:hypothetical protein